MPKITTSRIAVPGPAGSNGAAALAGNGVATTAARSDHNHDTTFVLKADKAWTVNKYRTANFVITGATVTALAGLDFNYGANEVWSFEYYLQIGSTGTVGIQVRLSSSGTGANGSATIKGTGASANSIVANRLTAPFGTTLYTFNTFANDYGWMEITGLVIGGSGAGIFVPQFIGAAGQTWTVYQQSYLTARRIS